MRQLLDYLHSLSPLSDELRAYLQKVLKRKILPKGDFLLKAGQVDSEVCFIQKGLIRCYKIEYGKEVKMRFMNEGHIAVSAKYVFSLKENREYMEVLEDCELLYITAAEAEHARLEYPDFRQLGFKLFGEYVCHHQIQFLDIPLAKGMHRYKLMLKEYPALIKRIPLKILAAYLRMDPAKLRICIKRSSHARSGSYRRSSSSMGYKDINPAISPSLPKSNRIFSFQS
jgi:CRP/FNR family transcriptional regulator, anaerobic regulatory protein